MCFSCKATGEEVYIQLNPECESNEDCEIKKSVFVMNIYGKCVIDNNCNKNFFKYHVLEKNICYECNKGTEHENIVTTDTSIKASRGC